MLTIVPTPVGNLEDVTARALKTLKEASAVYCEDTRRTRALMSHFGISTPLRRYHEHDDSSARAALAELKEGRHLALVSDSGTPCLSDPGRRLVALARSEGVPVVSLPGPSALAAAVAGSGLPGDSFVFLGFLPRPAGKRKWILKETAVLGRTLVVYESPFRVLDLLSQAAESLGPQAQACAAREISKVHEEWVAGTVATVRETLASRPELLGEFVVLFHPAAEPAHGVH